MNGLTVGDLKKILAGMPQLPDDTPIVALDPFGCGVQFGFPGSVQLKTDVQMVDYAWSRKRSEPRVALVLECPDTGPDPV